MFQCRRREKHFAFSSNSELNVEHILVADDEKNYLLVLAALLKEEGYRVSTASSGAMALNLLAEFEPDLLITDMRMPGITGMSLLEKAHEMYPELPLIIMTAYGTVEDAVQAMKTGASDYILKPFANQTLLLTMERCLKLRRLLTQNRMLREDLAQNHAMGALVGNSPAMRGVYELVQKVAATKATVLITGESGTGKELVARAIHQASPRAGNSFVAVHCMALSESLLESELFGHEKGAFTGANVRRKGRFEMAQQGTIFLDEVGEISPSLQVKLLRVLQERSFERVGGSETLQVDVRVVAATNRDLNQAVAQKKFREDLFYRLNVMQIKLPALRERREDLPLLAAHFVRKYAGEMGRAAPQMSSETMSKIYSYPWPGNVRELENAMERAVIVAGDTIMPRHLALEIPEEPGQAEETWGKDLNQAVEKLERSMIVEALAKADGVAAHAAQALGLSKTNLAYKMKKYNVN